MFKKMCILYVDNTPVSRHVIKGIEYGEKGFYRDTTSIDAFTNREHHTFAQNYRNKKKTPKRTDVRNYDEYIRDKESTKNSLKKVGVNDFVDSVEKTPIFEHENIKQFYEAIGYDIKKKKYI